tara:strand:+ start:32 stop:526 length:495 start_codon:yes stop_codon:yes gene_type:complete
MKKITYLIFSIVLLIFVSSCSGYKPIFASKNLQFKIADYSIEGNKILGNKIYSKLYRLSKTLKDNQNTRSFVFLIKASQDKDGTSKDSAGKILEYRIILNIKVQIIDFATNEEILNEAFVSSLTYKVQKQYSDTVNLENTSIEHLINKIYQELLIKFSENIVVK